MILAIGESATGLRFEIISHQARLPDQLFAITRPLFFCEIVIEQIIAPGQAVEQMSCGEIYIRLVARISPDVVTDGRVHVLAGSIQIFLIAFDLVNEGGLRDGDADVILLAALLRGWGRRIGFKSAHVADGSLPKLTVRSASAGAQFREFFVREVNTRMDA